MANDATPSSSSSSSSSSLGSLEVTPASSQEDGLESEPGLVKVHLPNIDAAETAEAGKEVPSASSSSSSSSASPSTTPTPTEAAVTANIPIADVPDVATLHKVVAHPSPPPPSSSSSLSSSSDDAPLKSHHAHEPPRSPELDANLVSRLTFWWLNAIVLKGAKQALMDEDMYEVNPQVDAHYCDQRFEHEWSIELAKMHASKKDPQPGVPAYQPSLVRALYKIFRRPFWIGFGCKALMDGLQFFQPILMQWMLGFITNYRRADDDTPAWHGYLYAMAIGINPMITSILSGLYFRTMQTTGLRIRTILTTQLYKKSLKLSPGARQSLSVGQIVNMMSTDASKIDLFTVSWRRAGRGNRTSLKAREEVSFPSIL